MFTHPRQWAKMTLPGYKLVHAPIFGNTPTLRGGAPMGDNVGGETTKKALKNFVGSFEHHRPDVFLWWATYCKGDGDKRQLESVQKAIAECKRIVPNCLFCYGNGNQAGVLLEGKPDWNVGSFEKWIDVVLDITDDPMVAKIYRKHGFRHDVLHTYAIDPSVFPDFTKMPAEYDAYFGGSYTGTKRFPNSGFRHRLMTGVDKRFNLLVSGRGKWKVKNKRKYLHADAYWRIFGEAKVALGCNHADLSRYYTKRSIYALASGRPYLVRYIPGMEKDFENGKHLVWYSTVDEAMKWLGALVEDEGMRTRIGTASRARMVERHSWAARLRDFGKVLGRVLS